MAAVGGGMGEVETVAWAAAGGYQFLGARKMLAEDNVRAWMWVWGLLILALLVWALAWVDVAQETS